MRIISNRALRSFHWKRSTAFSERVDRLELHGLHFQHINLCRRRAWMYPRNRLTEVTVANRKNVEITHLVKSESGKGEVARQPDTRRTFRSFSLVLRPTLK